MICTNCLETIADDSIFCSKCGAKQVRKVICKNCNAELDTKDNFCRVCGTPVQNVNSTVNVQAAEQNVSVGFANLAEYDPTAEDKPARATTCTSGKGFYASSKQAVTLLHIKHCRYKNLLYFVNTHSETYTVMFANMQLYPFVKIKKTA